MAASGRNTGGLISHWESRLGFPDNADRVRFLQPSRWSLCWGRESPCICPIASWWKLGVLTADSVVATSIREACSLPVAHHSRSNTFFFSFLVLGCFFSLLSLSLQFYSSHLLSCSSQPWEPCPAENSKWELRNNMIPMLLAKYLCSKNSYTVLFLWIITDNKKMVAGSWKIIVYSPLRGQAFIWSFSHLFARGK